jgi:nucleoside-diphosphate-sugar epimerase
MREKILVTGGTGFVGSNLVPILINNGYKVDVLVHDEYQKETSKEVSITFGDIRYLDTLPSFNSYNSVIHLAGKVSVPTSLTCPTSTIKTNTIGTQNILEKVRKEGVEKFIYLSSGSVYGNPEYIPTDESHPTNCLHPYAASKLAGENIAESYAYSYGFSVATLRAFTLYGPGQQSENLIPSVISKLSDQPDELSLGNLEPTRDFTFISDAVKGIIKILENTPKRYEVFNIGSGEETKVKNMVDKIASLMNQDVNIKQKKPNRSSDTEICRMAADTTKLEQLGWSSTYDIQTGIQETIEYSNND